MGLALRRFKMSGEHAIEKVELTQELKATFESGILPSVIEVARAKELGIDIKQMEKAYYYGEEE
jgi:hypothetical protein